MKAEKLTPRQWRLHDLIKSGNGKRFTKREIYEAVEGYEWHESASDKCPSIRIDMKAINASGECDSIIVFDHQQYYYATAEEASKFIARKIKTIRTAKEEIDQLEYKLSLNGQGKILNNALYDLSGINEPFHVTVRD